LYQLASSSGYGARDAISLVGYVHRSKTPTGSEACDLAERVQGVILGYLFITTYMGNLDAKGLLYKFS
jgi:hypothetical protein